jgi:hypothetical protein
LERRCVLSLLEEGGDIREKFRRIVRASFSSREGGLIQVTDITSHTLGVVLWDEGLLEEYVFPRIRKMTAIPASVKNSFGTATANMERAIVRVVEGESSLPSECTSLGICDVELPAFLPKGSPVELTYQYNANQVPRSPWRRPEIPPKFRSNATPAWRRVKLARQRLDWGRSESRRDDQVRNLVSNSITRRSAKVGWMEQVQIAQLL